MTIYFLFNKNTKQFIGFTLDKESINERISLFREIIVDPHEDLTNILWDGDYHNGKVIRINQSANIVTEYDLEEAFYQRLYKKYKPEELIKNILTILSETIDINSLKDEEAKQLFLFFNKNKNKLMSDIDYFKSNPKIDYSSKKEINLKSRGQVL